MVRIGERRTEQLYLYLPNVAEIILFTIVLLNGSKPFLSAAIFVVLSVLYFIPHTKTTNKLVAINRGKALNMVLGMTARDMFIFGVVTAIQIILLYNPV